MTAKDLLTQDEWDHLDALDAKAAEAWRESGVDVYLDLVEDAQPELTAIANRLLRINSKGGRPNKHSEKLFRSRRPEQEHLMPFGAADWPTRAPQPY